MNYKISRNLEYALMALSYMSEHKNQCVSAREMVQTFHCPFHPFSRVLQKLADQAVIESKKGIGGGYVFKSNLSEFSLYKLMSIVLPPIEIAACLSGHCDLLENCNIKNPVHYLNKKFVEFYKALNVQDILNCGDIKNFNPGKSLKNLANKNVKIQRELKTENKEFNQT